MNHTKKPQVICLIAPTASGKTALAYQLYDTGRYALISVDSALIYRDMNIGTAKPSAEELLRYPHALVDIIDPDQSYSVAQFVNDVEEQIKLAHDQGKTPVLVGGTLMYYMALLEGINDIPATLPQPRARVSKMIADQGINEVYAYLHQVDPTLAKRLQPNDSQRIGRAVEIFLQTGQPLSMWQQQPTLALANNPSQHWQILAIMPDRQWLHERIAMRLDLMWQQGFIEEVIALQQKYTLHANLPAMRCVGYRQVWEFLEKINAKTAMTPNTDPNNLQNNPSRFLLNMHSPVMQDDRQTMRNEALYATRQLAKRQYTWMRKLISTPHLAARFDIQPLTTIQQAKQLLIKTI